MTEAEPLDGKSRAELEDLAESATSRAVRRRARTRLSMPRGDDHPPVSRKKTAGGD